MIKMKVTELVFESEELEDCIKGFFLMRLYCCYGYLFKEDSSTYPIFHSVVYHLLDTSIVASIPIKPS